MNLNIILNDERYNFIKNHPSLKNRIILLTLAGSHSYGTATPDSDLDIRGIALETKSDILGFGNFEMFEHSETDTVINSVRKMFSLLLNCNPSSLENLAVKEEHVLMITHEGRALRESIDLFLTKKVAHSFGGYATAQLRRIENALGRGESQEKKEEHIYNSLKRQMNHLKKKYTEFTEEEIEIFIDDSEKDNLEKEIFCSFNLQKYPLRDLKNLISEMSNVIKDYDKLNHRNRKKSSDKLSKHAMHLIRLLLMSKEVLEGKPLKVYRDTEHELLMKIRNEEIGLEEVFSIVKKIEKDFEYAEKHSELPLHHDMKKIEALKMYILEEALKG